MSQQQLLLLVLGIVIVGLALLVGVDAFRSHARRSEADALVSRALDVAAAGIQWRANPLGTSGGSYAELRSIGLAPLGVDSTTAHGRFRVTRATADSLVISAVSVQYPEIGVRVYIGGDSVDRTEVSFEGEITLDNTIDLPPAPAAPRPRPAGAAG